MGSDDRSALTKRDYFRDRMKIGEVHVSVAIPIVISYAMSVTFTSLMAHNDQSWGGKMYQTYIAVAVLQSILIVLLAARGIFAGPSWVNWPFSFTQYWVQMLLLLHASLPNTLLTCIWMTRGVMEAVLSNVVAVGKQDHFRGTDYTFLTIAMVFSNIFSAYATGVLLANSAKFLGVAETGTPLTQYSSA